jgi:hypothetical protein
MFLIKGTTATSSVKEKIVSILSSVDLKDEAFLLLLNKWFDSIQDMNIRTFHTINRLKGGSIYILTNKYELMKWFIKTTFLQSLPCIVFSTYNESAIQPFFKHGSKHKFLKASDGFSGSGIKVVDSVEEVKHFLETYKPTEKFQGWILQDALEDIATFQGYKFHLRIWIIVVIRNGITSIYINNNHVYVLSNKTYDKTKLKEEAVYNTHERQNSKHAFFPMESPDTWTGADTQTAMKEMNKMFISIFKQQHAFLPDWKIKHGYELLGADVVFDTKHRPYILEINNKTGITESKVMCLPEVFHLAFGGAPLKLFSLLYGTSQHRITPFTKSLQMFYEPVYNNASDVNHAFRTLFHTSLESDADRSYLIYQSYTPVIARFTRKNNRYK